MLSFASIEEMEQQIDTYINMSTKTRNSLNRTEGFVSQQDLLLQAIDELNQLQTIEEAIAFKEKYSKYFLFNNHPEDEEFYNPYLPSEPGLSFVCDPDGNVEINGEVVNFNTIKTIEETTWYKANHELQSRATIDESTNYLMIHSGSRKLWAEARQRYQGRYIEFTAHRKTWLGWNKTSDNYYMRYISHIPSTWVSATLADWLVSQGPGAVFSTGEISSHTWWGVGGGYWNQTGNFQKAYMKLRINSARIGEQGVFSMII